MCGVRKPLALVPALVVAGLASSAFAAVSPIDPGNRPTPLPNAVNGVVAPSRLVSVIPRCTAARDAAPSLMRIFTMAREAGIALGADECSRTLANEVKFANQANQPGNNPACVASVSHAPNGKPVGTSMHGWGKAADLTEAGASLTFGSSGYAFMKQVAGSLGWNHPAFAEPGGSSCPEPWHWEWVGDGGTLHASSIRGDAVGLLPSVDDRGYATVTGLGALARHGSFVSRGSAANLALHWVVVGAASTPGRGGYWMVAADGGVLGFGNAGFHGSLGGRALTAPVNGMAPTRSGRGYWLVAWDGGIFTFGDARFYGSTGARRLNKPVVAMAPTPTGKGYWLVASDGGIFTFGDARFYGSTGGLRLVSPVVGIASTRSGKGYWLVAADGGVFTFGDARFLGSLGGARLASPAIALVPTKRGNGYWIELADATVAPFGRAANFGNG